jgi:hypothetical protein
MQTSVQINTAEAGQATLKEVSVKDNDHITNAEEPVPDHPHFLFGFYHGRSMCWLYLYVEDKFLFILI